MKKLLTLVLCGFMSVSLAGCGESDDAINLKVWGSAAEQSLLKELTAEFVVEQDKKAEEAGTEKKNFKFTYGIVGESDAKEMVLKDPTTAADVFAFAHDQAADLVNAKALYKVTRNKADVVSRNTTGSIAVSTFDDDLYAYPITADNGYFLYYDKSILSETDVQSLETIMSVSEAAGKKVNIDLGSGFYSAMFFFAEGVDGQINGTTCNFAEGLRLEAAKTLQWTLQHPALLNEDKVTIDGFGTTLAANVSGTWNSTAVQTLLGENYGVAKLPTANIGGVDRQLGSFSGYKLMGVNAQTKHPVEAMDLADFLTNEYSQVRRYEEVAAGPSNIVAQSTDGITENTALNALNQQNEFGYAQSDLPVGYWKAMEGLYTDLRKSGSDHEDLIAKAVAQYFATTS